MLLGAQLASPLKIEAIETGITESSSASKITLSGALPEVILLQVTLQKLILILIM